MKTPGRTGNCSSVLVATKTASSPARDTTMDALIDKVQIVAWII